MLQQHETNRRNPQTIFGMSTNQVCRLVMRMARSSLLRCWCMITTCTILFGSVVAMMMVCRYIDRQRRRIKNRQTFALCLDRHLPESLRAVLPPLSCNIAETRMKQCSTKDSCAMIVAMQQIDRDSSVAIVVSEAQDITFVAWVSRERTITYGFCHRSLHVV